jgi:hypothetical protein
VSHQWTFGAISCCRGSPMKIILSLGCGSRACRRSAGDNARRANVAR